MFAVAVLLGAFWGAVSIKIFIKGISLYRQETSQRRGFQRKEIKTTTTQDNKRYVIFTEDEFIDDRNIEKPKLKQLKSEMKQSSINANDSIVSLQKDCEYETGNENESTNIGVEGQRNAKSMNTRPSLAQKKSRYTGAIHLSITQLKFLEQSDSDTDTDVDRDVLHRVSIKLSKNKVSNLKKQKQERELQKLIKFIEKKIKKKTDKMHQELKKIFADESSHFINKKFIFVVLSSAVILLNIFFRGQTQTSAIGIKQCSAGDWISLFALGTFAFILSMFASGVLKQIYHWKRNSGYMFEKGDVHWNSSVTIKFLTISSILGLVAGLIGNGDGTVFIPFFIEIGMHPQVS